jgi:pimeloyl-ACP methyl ester carboxylesterase
MGAGDASQFRRHSARIGDLTISYLKGGRGKPLLYLHGLSGWGRWETYHLALAISHMVYAPQLPGWPDGQLPASIKSVSDYARIMFEFLDAIKVETTDLVAHSFGGWIAMYMAVAQPARFSKMVLADPMGLDVADAPSADLASMNEDSFLRAAFAQTGVRLFPGDFGAIVEDVRASQEFRRQWKGREIVANLVNGHYADPALTGSLHQITADTLVVWGREDRLVPLRHAEILNASIPRSKLAVIDGAGHTPMGEKRESFQRLAHDFLTAK